MARAALPSPPVGEGGARRASDEGGPHRRKSPHPSRRFAPIHLLPHGREKAGVAACRPFCPHLPRRPYPWPASRIREPGFMSRWERGGGTARNRRATAWPSGRRPQVPALQDGPRCARRIVDGDGSGRNAGRAALMVAYISTDARSSAARLPCHQQPDAFRGRGKGEEFGMDPPLACRDGRSPRPPDASNSGRGGVKTCLFFAVTSLHHATGALGA